MKTVNENNIHENLCEMLPGLPVEPEYDEPWRKARCSCSGSGRIEGKFDSLQMETVYDGLAERN